MRPLPPIAPPKASGRALLRPNPCRRESQTCFACAQPVESADSTVSAVWPFSDPHWLPPPIRYSSAPRLYQPKAPSLSRKKYGKVPPLRGFFQERALFLTEMRRTMPKYLQTIFYSPALRNRISSQTAPKSNPAASSHMTPAIRPSRIRQERSLRKNGIRKREP